MRARGDVDGRLVGRGQRFDVGHVRAVGGDGGLQETFGGGDCGEGGVDGDQGLGTGRNSEKQKGDWFHL